MSSVLVPQTTPIVLVVDDVAANRELVEAQLADLGYLVRQARDGLEALEQIAAEEPDLVLLDIEMPRMDGLTLCRQLKRHPTQRLIPIVLITALHDRATRLRGLEAGADDFLTKPFDAQELLVRTRVLLRDRVLNKHLDASETIILALARVIEARDLYTVYHAERVGLFSRAIGHAHGLSDAADLDVLYRGGVLHDVGKSVIPAEILLKPGPLSRAEFAIMERHAPEGERICLPLRSTTQYLPIIRHHHERWDGQGYPDHLAGPEIALSARIAAVADSWDAMTSSRAYRVALDPEEAVVRLRAGAASQWDAALVDLFLALVDQGVIDTLTRQQLEGETAAGQPPVVTGGTQ